MQSKKLLARSWAKEQRKKFCSSLTESELNKIHQLINKKILDSFKFQPSDIIAGYWPQEEEIDTRYLLKSLFLQKYEIVLPVIDTKKETLLFRKWSLEDSLKIGPYKIYEPFEDQPYLEPNILLIPLLSFDKYGYRLGYGKGYYDQTITALKSKQSIVTIGLSYEILRVDRLPVEPHDERLQWVITEKNTYNFSGVT